jgi:hypothetical protein
VTSVALATVAAVLAASAVHAASVGAQSTPACSTSTGLQLAKRFNLGFANVGAGGPARPVLGVLCGAFTGPGSRAMVVTLSSGGSIPVLGWAVLRLVGGSWHVVLKHDIGGFEKLTAAGGDFRETQPKFRKGDPLCCASGGIESRIWHWNGRAFTAGQWSVVTPAAPKTGEAIIFSPAAPTSCWLKDNGTSAGSWVFCWLGADTSKSHAKLGADGQLDTSSAPALPLGLGGPSTRYGNHLDVGRFRCSSAPAGFTCIVIATGVGFLFGPTGGVTRVGS